ncbi:DUF6527 family protein [Pseudomonas fluorescens]|uniref:Uncharacterized protein n=1 Tax=Pseudomonas fluorescens TaxID=294 RepID=A0A5E7VLI5_PSEFL|nr:DUF6527 family protein [Pseudomonas fluorescens]VVQ23589.1 hypothetical protein PS928_05567 [Pseudomonas fluorescens]
MTIKRLTPQFVEHFPEKLEPGELYLAMEFATAAHLCACGCGVKVITPFSPTDWQMSFDGETVSLKPSIGNWTFQCRSHYWVRSGRVEWAGDMSQEAINAGRKRDAQAKARQQANKPNGDESRRPTPVAHTQSQVPSLFGKLRKWLGL